MVYLGSTPHPPVNPQDADSSSPTRESRNSNFDSILLGQQLGGGDGVLPLLGRSSKNEDRFRLSWTVAYTYIYIYIYP